MKKILFYIAIVAVVVLIAGSTLAYFYYNSMLEPVSAECDPVVFEVESGSTVASMAQSLEDKGLIKNALAFRIHVKLENHLNLQAGHYEISPSMNIPAVAEKIFSGDAVFPDTVIVTFPEGKTLDEMAEIFANQTNNTKEQVMDIWNSDEFVQSSIENYWFVTEEVKNPDLKYPLNGYFFPNTYHFKDKDVSPEEAAEILLDEMDRVLSKYRDSIDSTDLSAHEILTMASIIEYEAIFDEDRPIVSGVFYNRLESRMRLQSCATLQMALGIHKQIYSNSDMAVDSPYNTYLVDGLPVGPGNSPGEPSIDAAINPAEHNYFYFLSDIYGDNKTYFSETYEQHNKLKNELLK
ncbi:endolytic transglycosylase MltG [Alkalibacter mobilis]|uniref:endolytic transglycosylase MltG n=1 Tax=Alkalibacter mobilis TaxID=2787712 RepID=UPI00189D2C72|nr:endolytic transglycosylase MltG [Alkalibacter mobilis]MBF7096400.1 endolytic transglycosylase MltG [Alkalibacter mobilis]